MGRDNSVEISVVDRAQRFTLWVFVGGLFRDMAQVLVNYLQLGIVFYNNTGTSTGDFMGLIINENCPMILKGNGSGLCVRTEDFYIGQVKIIAAVFQ